MNRDESQSLEEHGQTVKVKLNSGLYNAVIIHGRWSNSKGRWLVKLLDHPELEVISVLPSSIIPPPE